MNVPLVFIASGVFFTVLTLLLAKRQKKKQVWPQKGLSGRLWALLIGGPLLVFVAAGIVEISRQNRALAPFQPYLDEYLYLPGENAGNTVMQMHSISPTGSPYVRGKIVPVQIRNNTLDILYFDLPEELRAGNPDEVDTVVWLDCVSSTEKVEFVGGSKKETNRYTCDVAVIDRIEHVMVAKQSFEKTAGEQGFREVLYPDIVKYLAGLPRK